jgi:hypothetical protein
MSAIELALTRVANGEEYKKNLRFKIDRLRHQRDQLKSMNEWSAKLLQRALDCGRLDDALAADMADYLKERSK